MIIIFVSLQKRKKRSKIRAPGFGGEGKKFSVRNIGVIQQE